MSILTTYLLGTLFVFDSYLYEQCTNKIRTNSEEGTGQLVVENHESSKVLKTLLLKFIGENFFEFFYFGGNNQSAIGLI